MQAGACAAVLARCGANVYVTGPIRFGLPVDEACVQIKAGRLQTAFPVSWPSSAGCQVFMRFSSTTQSTSKACPKVLQNLIVQDARSGLVA